MDLAFSSQCNSTQLSEGSLRQDLFFFFVIRKVRFKFPIGLECLIYEMVLIKERRPSLNTQADSIRAKLFNQLTLF